MNDEAIIDSLLVSNAVAKVSSDLPVITSWAYENDDKSQPIMITAWVNDL